MGYTQFYYVPQEIPSPVFSLIVKDAQEILKHCSCKYTIVDDKVIRIDGACEPFILTRKTSSPVSVYLPRKDGLQFCCCKTRQHPSYDEHVEAILFSLHYWCHEHNIKVHISSDAEWDTLSNSLYSKLFPKRPIHKFTPDDQGEECIRLHTVETIIK
jgi:hypothetical protein